MFLITSSGVSHLYAACLKISDLIDQRKLFMNFSLSTFFRISIVTKTLNLDIEGSQKNQSKPVKLGVF